MPLELGVPLTIAGSIVDVTYERMPIERVRLNPDNPRVRFQIQNRAGGKKLAPDELMDLMREQPGYDGLQKDIRKAGGLHEPVIVDHDGLLIEGNSRTTAIKTLHAGNRGDSRWKTIPVARLPKNVPAHSLALLMASHHIARKTVWRPYAQADHIYLLRRTHGLSLAQIADVTRMSEREVEQYLDAYNYLVKEVLPHAVNGNGADVLESKFHHALEFVKRKNLADLRKDPDVRQKLAKLLVQDKIKGAEVRELDKVLKNRRASTALQTGGFKAARKALQETDPVAASKTWKDMQALTRSIGSMPQTDIGLLKKSAKAREVLIGLHDAIRNVAAIAGVKLGARNA